MPTRKIVDEHSKNMDKTVEFLRNELKSVRTGRAAPGLVEHLTVDYYGSPTPLKSLATIAAPEPQSLLIKPFDIGCLKDIEKAIKNSELSLAPIVDGKMIRLNLPPMSEERRKQIAQQVKQMGEKTKISIRNIRRDAIKQLEDAEKSKLISEDERDKGKEEIEKITKKHVDAIDEVINQKIDEIMSI
ncbi:MAG TPA: ribosome recycling factor [Phycisphaerales bacterium]|nr:ribosome recycling factor [Phycisphaerales bacterium]